ncbi:hypothetical protein EV127DRAFT_415166 [Xylaria flabelliformis]|nr:hypothetical protein EV127DRAFT_415166 [Xylaria flabelliformis]
MQTCGCFPGGPMCNYCHGRHLGHTNHYSTQAVNLYPEPYSPFIFGTDISAVGLGLTLQEFGQSLYNTNLDNIGFGACSVSANDLMHGGYPLSSQAMANSGSPPPPDTPKPHVCNKCLVGFRHKKDLKRHTMTVHKGDEELVFRCRCEKDEVRKDNYLRHLRSCNKHYRDCYTCKCRSRCDEKAEHISHVRICRYGFGRTGRPSST